MQQQQHLCFQSTLPQTPDARANHQSRVRLWPSVIFEPWLIFVDKEGHTHVLKLEFSVGLEDSLWKCANHRGRKVTLLQRVPLKHQGDEGVTHFYKTPLISRAVSICTQARWWHHVATLMELHSKVRQSYLHPLFNLAVHRVPYSFISMLEIGRLIMPPQLPWHYLCSWQIGLPLCLNSARALTLNTSVGRLPATASSGESAGRREAAWKAPAIANGGQYNGCYSKSTQRPPTAPFPVQ